MTLPVLVLLAAFVVGPIARFVPNDPLLPLQWPLDNSAASASGVGAPALSPGLEPEADIDAPEAWHISGGTAETVIAILDDGVDGSHPDLSPNLSAFGMDFSVLPPGRGGHPREPGDSHGTSVAGLAAGRGDNRSGIVGVCHACTVLPIRLQRRSDAAAAAAVDYAVEMGADVILVAWGYPMTASETDPFADALARAARSGRDGRGLAIVVAAPNEATDFCRGPAADLASLAHVISIGVSDQQNRVGASGFGDCIDLVAPSKPRYRSTRGVMTSDRLNRDGYSADAFNRSFGGTSAAAALVAGSAGLLLSINPELTADELRRMLTLTADRVDRAAARYDRWGHSRYAGWGKLNAAAALLPAVRLVVQPARVAVGEPFSVTVIATAPFGIGALGWRVSPGDREEAVWQSADNAVGRPVFERTWTGVVIDRPGTFRFEAQIQSRTPPPGRVPKDYPLTARPPVDDASAVITVTGEL